MLDEDNLAVGFEYASDFIQRELRVANGTKRPGEHDRIDASVGKRN